MTRFQLTSDVHLDHLPRGYEGLSHLLEPTGAPYLIVAGDLGDPFTPDYKAFLADATRAYQQVILVPGNHEFYSMSGDDGEPPKDMAAVRRQLQALQRELPGLLLLDNASVLLGGEGASGPGGSNSGTGGNADAAGAASNSTGTAAGATAADGEGSSCAGKDAAAASGNSGRPNADGGSPHRPDGTDASDKGTAGGAVRVIGTTLWSHCPAEVAWEVQSCMSDYTCIYLSSGGGTGACWDQEQHAEWDDGLRAGSTGAGRGGMNKQPQRLTVSDTNDLFAESVAFLRAELARAEAAGERVLVVTHHLPSFRCVHPRFKGSDINHGFASNLDRLFKTGNVRAWVFGHTHESHDEVVRDGEGRELCRLVCNPHGYGYREQGRRTSYNRACVVEV